MPNKWALANNAGVRDKPSGARTGSVLPRQCIVGTGLVPPSFIALKPFRRWARLASPAALGESLMRASLLVAGNLPLPLEHVPKKLLDFFDFDMLILFEFERFHFDHVIPRDGKAL